MSNQVIKDSGDLVGSQTILFVFKGFCIQLILYSSDQDAE